MDNNYHDKEKEPAFHAYLERKLKYSRILCLVAIPIGIYLKLYIVIILGVLGIIISTIKLTAMKN